MGTTSVRALESAAATGRMTGRTELFLHAGAPVATVDVLMTNFHLPRTTLLMLVEAVIGPRWRPGPAPPGGATAPPDAHYLVVRGDGEGPPFPSQRMASGRAPCLPSPPVASGPYFRPSKFQTSLMAGFRVLRRLMRQDHCRRGKCEQKRWLGRASGSWMRVPHSQARAGY